MTGPRKRMGFRYMDKGMKAEALRQESAEKAITFLTQEIDALGLRPLLGEDNMSKLLAKIRRIINRKPRLKKRRLYS